MPILTGRAALDGRDHAGGDAGVAACSPATAFPSAWTARAPGATTYSLNGCGAASNPEEVYCEPTKGRRGPRASIGECAMVADRTKALTTPARISLLQPAASSLAA